jgi:hypothetical protein
MRALIPAMGIIDGVPPPKYKDAKERVSINAWLIAKS